MIGQHAPLGDGTAEQRSQIAPENTPSTRTPSSLAANNSIDAVGETAVVTVSPLQGADSTEYDGDGGENTGVAVGGEYRAGGAGSRGTRTPGRNRRNSSNPQSQARMVRGTREGFQLHADRRRAEQSIGIARQLAGITSDLNRTPVPQAESMKDNLQNYQQAKRLCTECEEKSDTRGSEFYDSCMRHMETTYRGSS